MSVKVWRIPFWLTALLDQSLRGLRMSRYFGHDYWLNVKVSLYYSLLEFL